MSPHINTKIDMIEHFSIKNLNKTGHIFSRVRIFMEHVVNMNLCNRPAMIIKQIFSYVVFSTELAATGNLKILSHLKVQSC